MVPTMTMTMALALAMTLALALAIASAGEPTSVRQLGWRHQQRRSGSACSPVVPHRWRPADANTQQPRPKQAGRTTSMTVAARRTNHGEGGETWTTLQLLNNAREQLPTHDPGSPTGSWPSVEQR